jgi:hypothetical protein
MISFFGALAIPNTRKKNPVTQEEKKIKNCTYLLLLTQKKPLQFGNTVAFGPKKRLKLQKLIHKNTLRL